LYGHKIWCLTLKEGYRLRIFENRVLKKIFGPKREEVTGDWRKLYSEELHGLYSRQIFTRFTMILTILAPIKAQRSLLYQLKALFHSVYYL
jgi:hypothetical protein